MHFLHALLLLLILGIFTVLFAEAVAQESSIKVSFLLRRIFCGNQNEIISLVEIDVNFNSGLFIANSKPLIPLLISCNPVKGNSVLNAVIVPVYLHAKGLTFAVSKLFSCFLHIKIKAKTGRVLLQIVKNILFMDMQRFTTKKFALECCFLFSIFFKHCTLTLIKYFDWKKNWIIELRGVSAPPPLMTKPPMEGRAPAPLTDDQLI